MKTNQGSSTKVSTPDQDSEFAPEKDAFKDVRKKGTIRWIIKHLFLGINKFLLFSWLVFDLVAAFFASSIMVMIGDAIDEFIKGPGVGSPIPFVVIVFVLGIGAPLLSMSGNLIRELLAQRLERETRKEFYVNLLGKSQSFHDEQRIGDIMARTAEDVRLLNFLVSPALTIIIDASINMGIPFILILLNYPWQLVFVPGVFAIVFIFATRKYIRDLTIPTQQIREEFGNMDATINETLGGIDVVKSLVREVEEKRKYTEHAQKYRENMIKEGYLEARYIPLFMIAVTATAGLVHGIILYQAQAMLIGQVIGYIGLLLNLRYPTYVSIWAFSLVRQAVSASERLLEIMNKETMISQNTAGVARQLDGHVVFDHVTFAYPGTDKPVLKDISFKIEPGQTIAIVGTTGSGKTTLTKLLSRLYDVSSGQILIDDIPIQGYSLQSLRSQIAFIEQDIFLFSTSITENISFSRAGSEEEIVDAAKEAQAHDFIMNLPKQYGTSIGEEGVQLSGGERQRIAIARAFLSNPRILVLDDATSAIDSATEEQIQRAIQRILQGRTTFLITHRLSQIRWADRILVMKQGQVIAQGTHFELLRTCDEYQKIFIKRFDMPLEELLEEEVH
ncbi:MAG TPA: ABC transporter ATP-binding protein [Candidatus Lokiarchaeia archaeon]|nr:ABC transporter ATP-binding protein [Candidatus Lokiarchaeia archaeon]